MDEQTAKQKWCPMVRVVYGIGDNRGLFESTTKCIGSDCMMWQDTGLEKESNQSVRAGKCGLAGKP